MKKLNVRVASIRSPKTGKAVANQFTITTPHGEMFQSYKTLIAFRANNGQLTLDPSWDCSRTTLKYLKEFMGADAATTNVIRKRISAGVYKLEELN